MRGKTTHRFVLHRPVIASSTPDKPDYGIDFIVRAISLASCRKTLTQYIYIYVYVSFWRYCYMEGGCTEKRALPCVTNTKTYIISMRAPPPLTYIHMYTHYIIDDAKNHAQVVRSYSNAWCPCCSPQIHARRRCSNAVPALTFASVTFRTTLRIRGVALRRAQPVHSGRGRTYIYACIYTCVGINIYTRWGLHVLQIYIHISHYIYIYICLYKYIYVHTCIYIYIYTISRSRRRNIIVVTYTYTHI